MNKNKKLKIALIIVIVLIVLGMITSIIVKRQEKIKDDYTFVSVGSKDKLMSIYSNFQKYNDEAYIPKLIATLPYSLGYYMLSYDRLVVEDVAQKSSNMATGLNTSNDFIAENIETEASVNQKDYSTTNIQVENVDEADITKTDGKYIYSISNDKVIITDVRNKTNLKIASEISMTNSAIPEDIILYKNKLVIIGNSSNTINASSYYSYSYNNSNTIVNIYDLTNKTDPKIEKKYEADQKYYTSRCINNKLYIISSGYLEKNDDEIIIQYKEDSVTKNVDYNNIKYIPNKQTRNISTLALIDLDNISKEANIKTYLIDVENAYISENNMYLINEEYEGNDLNIKLSNIFGLFGVWGIGNGTYDVGDYGYYTKIYKFNIKEDDIEFLGMGKEKGKSLNQFSFDEHDGYLRAALQEDNLNGTKVVVFNEKMEKIGELDDIAKGEKMYSSRFIGNKVYLVTYKTIDPLFVISLEKPTEPIILGELKIPGYSTYLHPYDENHIIGIGMETKETINRNSSGKVTSTTARIIGMKMALFDVSDVNNPKELSNTVIGDSRTTSSILTNHKALLFSREKNLIAIPVNNYSEDFEVSNSSDMSRAINLYKNYSKEYISEGYLVYDLTLENGFKQKGTITHELLKNAGYYYSYNNTRMLRGLYIDNDLYTISETAVKVNKLDTLEQISEMKIVD